MEKVLKLIVDADKAAREKVVCANERREALSKEIEQSKAEIEQKYASREKAELEAAQEEEEKRKADAIEKLQADYEKNALALDTLYAEKSEAWANELFTRALLEK